MNIYICTCVCVCVCVSTGPVHWSFRKGPVKPLAALPRAADGDDDGGYTQEDGAAQEFTSAYAKGKKGGKKKEAFFLDLTGTHTHVSTHMLYVNVYVYTYIKIYIIYI